MIIIQGRRMDLLSYRLFEVHSIINAAEKCHDQLSQGDIDILSGKQPTGKVQTNAKGTCFIVKKRWIRRLFPSYS